MSKIKPSLPKGTRDFGPVELRKRQYIFNTIKSVFEKYGFQPIETPVMENLATLEGKYGEEGDKLLFRILNSGDNLTEIQNSKDKIQTNKDLIQTISEKGLRYDLTIPFARYVVMHQNEIIFPFKRYQIQPVWRADRPQRGRYREFYQCDADVIGSDSLLNEVELVLIYSEVFQKLGIKVKIVFNNRKILQGIAEYCGCIDKLDIITSSIDKLDKIGREGVVNELTGKGIPKFKIERIFDCLEISQDDYVFDTVEELIANGLSKDEAEYEVSIENNRFRKDYGTLNCLAGYFLGSTEVVSDTGLSGIKESKYLLSNLFKAGVNAQISYDVFLARGLDYYTGTIFEVKANDIQMGSIGGGGRYDNLTGVFGLEGVSGVGVSFGIERIYDVMEELGLFKHLDLESSTTKVLFVNFGGVNELQAFEYTNKVRQQNIAAEMYPASVKLDKQMKYANAKKIPFVAFVGEAELKNNTLQLKNMQTGEQFERSIEEAIKDLTDSSKL